MFFCLGLVFDKGLAHIKGYSLNVVLYINYNRTFPNVGKMIVDKFSLDFIGGKI